MKIETILIMYDILVNSGTICRQSFCVAHGISERTFYRYMREINDFFREHKHEYIVDSSRENCEYYIKTDSIGNH